MEITGVVLGLCTKANSAQTLTNRAEFCSFLSQEFDFTIIFPGIWLCYLVFSGISTLIFF